MQNGSHQRSSSHFSNVVRISFSLKVIGKIINDPKQLAFSMSITSQVQVIDIERNVKSPKISIQPTFKDLTDLINEMLGIEGDFFISA